MKKGQLKGKMNRFRKNASLLLAAFMLLGSQAKSQITYTDINPDLAGSHLTQAVSGTIFEWNGMMAAFATSPYGGALIMAVPTAATPDHIGVVDQGTMIGATSSWNVDGNFTPPANGGTPTVVTDKYLGFRIGTAGNYKYGWFKVDINTNSTTTPWTIKSYAYQNTLNTAIAAGDMGNGTGTVVVAGITVNGAANATTITTNHGTLQMSATVTPTTATNSAVTWSVTPATLATISTTGLLTATANGTVTVKATAADGSNVSGTKAIVITNQKPTGINDIKLLAINCYPNPVHDNLFIQFNNDENIVALQVYNIGGQLVLEDNQNKNGSLLQVNTQQLPNGLYTLIYKNDKGAKGIQKFTKAN